MIHRRLKGPSNWNCGELFRGVSCLYLPHGFYSLLAAALASMAFWTTLVQDGCDYVKLEGGNVELISGSDVLPYLEVGVSQYRAPLYYTASSEWKMVYTEECLDYPMDQEKDMLWNMARWTTFCSSVLGGGVALFLWFSTCFTLSIRTWRFCAVEAALAAVLRGGSFVLLFSEICSANSSSCSLYFGSHMDITAVVLWIVTSFIMLGHYPDPKLRVLTEAEIRDEIAKGNFGGDCEDDLRPKRLSVSNAGPGENIVLAQINEVDGYFEDAQPLTSKSKGYNDGQDDLSFFARDGNSIFSHKEGASQSNGDYDGQSFFSENEAEGADGQSYHSRAYEEQSYFAQQSRHYEEASVKGTYL